MTSSEWDFQKIHEDFRPKIVRYLARLVGEYDAEDLAQEVFIKVNHGLATFRGDSQLSTWIYRIATHTALDKMRSPSFKYPADSELTEEKIGSDSVDPFLESSKDTLLPEAQLFLKQRVSCYCEFIEHLPTNYRAIVALSELEELTVTEIAAILGLTLDTVKIRLHRGRIRLLQELKAHCKAEDWL